MSTDDYVAQIIKESIAEVMRESPPPATPQRRVRRTDRSKRWRQMLAEDGDEYGRIFVGENQQAGAKKLAEQQRKAMSLSKMEMGKIDKARDDEQARETRDREFWNLDQYPVQWDKRRKMEEAQKNVLTGHAFKMAGVGALTSTELKQFLAAWAEHGLTNLDMEDYKRLRQENPYTGETPIDAIRKAQALDRTGDVREDQRKEREVVQKVVKNLGAMLNHGGFIDDEGAGRLLREAGIVADDLVDADGNVVLTDTQLGAENWLEHTMGDDTKFKTGDFYREDQAKAAEKAAQEDLVAHNYDGSDIVVSDKEAEAWRARQEHDRLASSPHGRQQLKDEARRAELSKEIDRLTDEVQRLATPAASGDEARAILTGGSDSES
jgi:hypothetical protein